MSYPHVTRNDQLVKLDRGTIAVWPYSLAEFLRDHPGIWPDPMPLNRLADHGVHQVIAEPEPEGDPFAGRLVPNAQPHLQVLGHYSAAQAAAKGTPERAGAPIIGSHWVLGWRREAVPVAQARAAAHAALLDWANSFLSRFIAPYTEAERLSWPLKDAAAEAYLAGAATPRQVSLLEIEAATRGVSTTELARSITDKAGVFRAVIMVASGLRSRVQAQIDAADPHELQAILDAARQEALAKAEDLGIL